MPQVDLSTLSGPELRRLLDAARARGEASLSYKILQEMAARRESREARGRSAMRRAGEPRIVALNLGDPLEHEAEPPPEIHAAFAEPEPEPAARRSRRGGTRQRPMAPASLEPDDPAPEPPPSPPPRRPRGVWDDEPGTDPTDPGLRLRPPERQPPRPARGLRRGLGVGFASGMAAGVALGWWAGQAPREPPAAPVTPVAAPIQAAEPPPVPAVASAAQPAPQVETPAPAAAEAAPSPPETGEVAEAETTEAPAPSVAADACAEQPTPADRTICGDPDRSGCNASCGRPMPRPWRRMRIAACCASASWPGRTPATR